MVQRMSSYTFLEPSSPETPPTALPGPGGPMPPLAPPFPLGDVLARPANFDQIFRVVRGAVKHVLRRERTGLGLGLSDLPPSLGAYWQVTGNLIVMNEGLVRTMKAMAESTLEFNSFVY